MEQGHRSIFLDFDPEDGIPAGRIWEKELYAKLRGCQAVIVLCSEHSMASQWCLIEIALARSLGKHSFPVKVAACQISPLLSDVQVTDITLNPTEGYQRLWSGLKKVGLDPMDLFDWDGSRSPYPGLLAFQEQDAAVYFGRGKYIQTAMETLNRLQRLGGARLVLVFGASGSGKSSLVRAGVIPRLKREKDRWLVLDPFRPLGRPFDQLAMVLAGAFTAFGNARDWKSIRHALNPLDDNASGAHLLDLTNDLRVAAGRREATVLLVVDQLEELLGRDIDPSASLFLRSLKAVLSEPNSPFLAVATLRSDFLGAFQTHEAVQDLLYEPLPLPQMALADFAQVIEGPAKVASIELEAGLAQAMVADTATDDALPLLAFTLRELWDRYNSDGRLTLEEYRDRLGGLQGSLARAAEAIFAERTLSVDEELHLRKAFLSMVRIDEEGRYVRKPAPWTELPEDVHDLLERFVQARLLVARSEGAERILEVAHEALFRSWDRLVAWLNADREFLLWRQRLRRDIDEWERNEHDESMLLRGPVLAEAERWLQHKKNLTDEECHFIRQSAKAQLRRKTLAAGTVMLSLLSLGFVWWFTHNQLSLHMLVWLLRAPFGYTPEPQMVDVRPGSFLMGSPESDGKAEASEKPQHRVVVHKPFRIGKFEVTFDEYDFFVHLTGRRLPDHNGWGRGRQPVINVTWDDAQAYAAWLRERTGRRYRLTTEAEWEYTARAGTTTVYWWRDELPATRHANCADCGNEWSNKRAAPVGAFLENPWGLHDTAGNVGEWVQDCMHENYQGAPSAGNSAWEDANGNCLMRMLRGGSWNNGAWFARSAFRIWYVPDYQSASIGFRLAQDLD